MKKEYSWKKELIKKGLKTDKSNEWWSHNNRENIVVTVESALAVGADVEDLWEFELLIIVHNQTSWHKNQEASLDGSWLDVLMVDAVCDLLESEWFNLLRNFLHSLVCLTSIGHDAVVIVEVDELGSVLHDSCVVLGQDQGLQC